MFHPTLDPKGLSDQELESRIKETLNKLNQASRMQNANLYDQLLAINNSYMLEVEQRKMAADKKKRDAGEDEFDHLINIK